MSTVIGRRVFVGDHVLYVDDNLVQRTAHVTAINLSTLECTLDGGPAGHVQRVPYDAAHGRNTWDYNQNYTIGTIANTSTTPFTVDTEFCVLVDCTASDVHVNLPASALNAGRLLSIHYNAGGNNVIVDPFAGDNIDGGSSYTMTDVGRSVLLVADGATGWHTMANNF